MGRLNLLLSTMATHHKDKPSVARIEAIESANTSDQDVHLRGHDANEDIVRHLQTTGEEVGMTCTGLYDGSMDKY